MPPFVAAIVGMAVVEVVETVVVSAMMNKTDDADIQDDRSDVQKDLDGIKE